MGKIAYFDCFSGAAGDMLLGSLLDAGLSLQALQDYIDKLNLPDVKLRLQPVNKSGIAAKHFGVTFPKQHQHRNLATITGIINAADLPKAVTDNACRIFTRLADAEARVHGIDVQQVHFHEVGAVDAIVDIVGFCVALHELGIERIHSSPLVLGRGSAPCEHGQLPVPAPATIELARGVPVAGGEEQGELTTPTGAAILTTLADGFGPIPPMTVESVGYGAGTRDGKALPNVLRVLIGYPSAAADADADAVSVLETQIDDMPGEQIAYLCERLLGEGALDVVQMPIYMKKARPGVLVQVLCRLGDEDRLIRTLFEHSSTFGVRRHMAVRSKLTRRWQTVQTPYGAIRVKLGFLAGTLRQVAPEYDDCQKAAAEHAVPLARVFEQARQQVLEELDKK